MQEDPNKTIKNFELKPEDKEVIADTKIPKGEDYLKITKRKRYQKNYAVVYEKVLEISKTN